MGEGIVWYKPVKRVSILKMCVLALAILAGAAPIAAAAFSAERDVLRMVVEGCEAGMRTMGVSFPCLSVTLPGEGAGYAVIRPPLSRTQVLVVPTAPIPGIESMLLKPGLSSTYWEAAWNARVYVERRLGHGLEPGAVGVAVNSAKARSQDQLHLHVDCVKTEVEASLSRLDLGISDEWRAFPNLFDGHLYWIRRLDNEALAGVDPMGLLAAAPYAARNDPSLTSIAILGRSQEGGGGFYVLATAGGHNRIHGGLAEELLDHDCSGR